MIITETTKGQRRKTLTQNIIINQLRLVVYCFLKKMNLSSEKIVVIMKGIEYNVRYLFLRTKTKVQPIIQKSHLNLLAQT